VKLSLSRDVVVTNIENGAVLLDGRRGRYWQLNESGATALQTLLAGTAPAAVAARLASGTPVPDEEALRDVLALIEALRQARLLEVSR
jgi:Coenzyme PQQ synthesis protein D (PqqD)